MYWAFYDASGTQTDTSGPVVVVSVVAAERKWMRFERQWNEVLSDLDVSHLRMKKYVHSVDVYEEWKGDTERRADLSVRLLSVIKQNVDKVIFRSFRVEKFR